MALRSNACLLLVVTWLLTVAAIASYRPIEATVDLGWLEVRQTNAGWRIVRISDPLPPSKALHANDIILAVDALRLNNLNALSVARILNLISQNSKVVEVMRDGVTMQLSRPELTEPLAAPFLEEANSNPISLYAADQPAPAFSLPDASGRMVNITFQGKWTLIHLWNTLCDRTEIAALNEMAKPSPDLLNIVGVSISDTPGTLDQFSTKEKIGFLNVIGGSYDGPFAGKYDYFRIQTDILVEPGGRIVFIGSGPTSLATAWRIFRERTLQERILELGR